MIAEAAKMRLGIESLINKTSKAYGLDQRMIIIYNPKYKSLHYFSRIEGGSQMNDHDPDQFVMRKPLESCLFIALSAGGFVATVRLLLVGLTLQALLALGFGVILTLCSIASLRWRLRVDSGGLHVRRLCGPEKSLRVDEIDHYLLISAQRQEIRVYTFGGLFECIPRGATKYLALEDWLIRHASGKLLLTPVEQSFTIPPRHKP